MRVVAVAPGSTEGGAGDRDGDVGPAGAGRFSRRARAALCGVMTPRHDGGARGDGAGSKAVSALALDRGDRRSAWSTPDASRASYVAAARITLAWIIHEHFFRIRLATFGWALTNMGRLNGPYSRFRHPKRAVGPPKSPIGSQSNSMNVFISSFR